MFKNIHVLFLSTISALLYSPNSDVIKLTEFNFHTEVETSKNLWVIEFYVDWCEHCKKFAPEYMKVATGLVGFVKVGAVNVDENKSLVAQYKIDGFPSIKIFNEARVQDYEGERTAKDLIDAVFAAATRKVELQLLGRVPAEQDPIHIILTDKNFDENVLNTDSMWIIIFITKWCDLCTKLLPEWKSAAIDLKNKVKVGIYDATIQKGVANNYNIDQYPTIVYFIAGPKSRFTAERYVNDPNKVDVLIKWAEETYIDNLPPSEINQFTNLVQLEATCKDKQLCVIIFLPYILDCQSKCRNQYLLTLYEVANEFRSMHWGWLWSEAHAQNGIEKMLGIDGVGYPSMAVINFAHFKQAFFKGAFEKDEILKFLRNVSYGKVRTQPFMPTNPEIVNVPEWDGLDLNEDVSVKDKVGTEKPSSSIKDEI